MLLLIDNYDSFTFNLFQQVTRLAQPFGWPVVVKRNDEMTSLDAYNSNPRAVIISPGPGGPADTGICSDLLPMLRGKIPVLGVCLGHQLIGELAGATIRRARSIMHGKSALIAHDGAGLFTGCPGTMRVARYHSLAVDADTLPPTLAVRAWSEDGEVMALESKEEKTWGVQFHPESFLTENGDLVIQNFLNIVADHHGSYAVTH